MTGAEPPAAGRAPPRAAGRAADAVAPVLRLGSSLQVRFMLVVIAGAGVFAVASALLAYRVGHQRGLDNARASLQGLLLATEKTAAIGAFAHDTVLLGEVADGLASNPLAGRVEVLGTDGALLLLRGPVQRAGQATAAPQGTGAASVDGSNAVAVERRLLSPFDRAEPVGLLRIVADPALLQAAARAEATTLALLIVGQTAIVALLLYLVAARLVSLPIVRLANALRAMEPGCAQRLDLPPLHRNNEIGMLVASANALLQANEAALQSERALRDEIAEMEAQYRQIFDSSSAGIFVLDAAGRLINGNPTVLKVIGSDVRHVRDLRGLDFLNMVFARPDRARAIVEEAAQRRETVSADLELVQRSGFSRWVHCLISVQAGAAVPARAATDDAAAPDPTGRVVEGVMYDVTERKRAERAVLHQASHDALTGLKNRAASEAAIERQIADALADSGTFTVLFIDLDGFKRVNDVFGHDAGDAVLQECATRLLRAVRRASDLVGRLGGDEFIVALAGTGSADMAVCTVARAIVDALMQPVVLRDGRRTGVGASIGIAAWPRHGVDLKQLLHSADAAMYEVKRHGKNSYAIAASALTAPLPPPPPATRQPPAALGTADAAALAAP